MLILASEQNIVAEIQFWSDCFLMELELLHSEAELDIII